MIVVDSSVAFKWLVPEEDSAAAEALVGQDRVAPDLLLLECGNALWKRVRRSAAPATTIPAPLVTADSRLVGAVRESAIAVSVVALEDWRPA